jgi:hypothetical protein
MITEALAAYAATTARVFEDRNSTVGASEIGSCARKVYFTKNAGNPTHRIASDVGFAESRGATLRGRLLEDHFWVPALRARFGPKLLYAGDEQRTLASGFLSATPDGLLVDMPRDALAYLGVPDIGEDRSIVVEAKSIDPRVQFDDGPKPEHVYQVIVQMGLLREVTRHRPQYAVISYVNASFLDDVTEFAIQFDPQIFDNAKKRAAQIMTATAAGEIKPEGWVAGGKECERCPFAPACGIERRAVPPPSTAEADLQFIAELRELAVTAKEQRSIAEAAAAHQRDAEHAIRERLRAKGLRKVADEDFGITWSAVKGRSGIDVKALTVAATDAGVDVTQFATTAEPTDRLVIRVREAGPNEFEATSSRTSSPPHPVTD